MPELEFKEIQPFLFAIAGLALIAISIFKKSSRSYLLESGVKAEGIIYKLANKPNNPTSWGSSDNIMDKVTVRFVTENKEWITEDIKQDFAGFYTGQYEEGQTIDVYYDPQKPSNFYIDTKQSETFSRMVFAFMGLGLLAIGAYQILY